MSVGILIGFEYLSEIEKSLPGIIFDLYSIHNFFNDKLDSMYLITDILHEDIGNIISYYNLYSIQFDPEHFFNILGDKLYRKTDPYEILSLIGSMVNGKNKIFFYYSGHSDENDFIFPGGYVKKYVLLRTLMEFSNKGSEIFILTDCCHGGIKINYKISPSPKLQLSDRYFTSKKIISISSTDQNDVTETNLHGSEFTKKMISYLQKSDITLNNFSEFTIHLSHPNIQNLWIWLIKYSPIMIEFLETENILLVRR